MENFIAILGYVLTPISAAAAWFTGRKKANNDFLQNMQASIDMLIEKNKDLTEEIIKLRGERINLLEQVSKLRSELEELNAKLENVKTITRSK